MQVPGASCYLRVRRASDNAAMHTPLTLDAPPALKDRRPTVAGAPRAFAKLRSLLGITPYAHQSDATALMMENLQLRQSFALLHDMGCGKTLSVLGAFLMLVEEGSANTLLVVCPSSVIGAWEKECAAVNRHRARAGEPPIDCLPLTQASVAQREAAMQARIIERSASQSPPPLVVVTNYESTWRMEDALRAQRFDMIACDESQRIKAPGSKQSRAMLRIGRTAKYRAIMSGTPIPEGALGWYGQFRFLDERVFGTSYVNFKAKYAIEIDCGTFRKVDVNRYMLPELEAKVMGRAHRVSKEDAVDLPPQTSTTIEFDLSPAGRKMYDQLVKDSIAILEDAFGEIGEIVADHVLTRILRLQQLAGGFAQLDSGELKDVCKAKRRACTDLMEDLRDAGKKLAIFHRFSHEGREIEKIAQRVMGKNGPAPCVINGSIPTSERGEAVRRFQEGDALFFVGQIVASGTGITLHAASDSCFFSTGYSGADYEQALARIHRIGQERPVTHHHLTARGTVDLDIYNALLNKRSIAEDMTTGAWKRYLTGG